MSDKLYLVVASESEQSKSVQSTHPKPEVPTTILGIATSISHARDMVGKDFLDILSANHLNPIDVTVVQEISDEVISFKSLVYDWHIIPVESNTLVNLSL